MSKDETDKGNKDNDKLVIYRSRKVRRHGCEYPFSLKQILTWVLALFLLISFGLTLITELGGCQERNCLRR